MTSATVKVVYIAGTARSGSTILDVLLGHFDGFVSTGTLLWIWNDGVLGNHPCGCGQAVRDCPFWTSVFERAFDGLGRVDAARLARLQRRFTASTSLAGRARSATARGTSSSAELDDYLDALDRLYRAIRDVGGARVIVDSSKLPLYAALLKRIPSLEVDIIHLVRDPRATAFSWMRRTPDGSGRFLEKRSPLRSAAYWTVRNRMIHALGPSRLMAYEQFARAPRATVEGLARELTGNTAGSPFLDAATVQLRPSHTVGGNPARFGIGSRRITSDEAWKTAMPRYARLAVTATTWPWLKRYGYR